MSDASASPLDEGPLGKPSVYPSTYTPSLLHSMDRAMARAQVGVDVAECKGEDLWTGYEFTWLNTDGKPCVAGVRLRVPCHSRAIVESKSLKLYLGSFAQTKFENLADVLRTLDQDLTLAYRGPVMLELLDLVQLTAPVQQFSGVCLDDLDVRIKTYERDPSLLSVEDPGATEHVVHESLFTHLFRSLCPVTAQPDYASVYIEYLGSPIAREGLLQYLVSYREHQAFHETTIEQIYADLLEKCRPRQLTVYGRFQRRGGLDINPFRSTHEDSATLCRLPRQ